MPSPIFSMGISVTRCPPVSIAGGKFLWPEELAPQRLVLLE